jgi:hypothetical protein
MPDPTPVVHHTRRSPRLRRENVGVDISALAEFVAGVKSTAVSDAELETLARWAGLVAESVDIRRPSTALTDYQELGYYKHRRDGGSSS